jgi:hypothetical protein
VAEGAPLLREYTAYTRIEGSNPSLSAIIKEPRLVRGFLMIGERGSRIRNPVRTEPKASSLERSDSPKGKRPKGRAAIPPSPPSLKSPALSGVF